MLVQSKLILAEPADKIAVLNSVYTALVGILNSTTQAVERLVIIIYTILLTFIGWFVTSDIERDIATVGYFALSPLIVGVMGYMIARRLSSRYHDVAYAINRFNLAQRVTEPGIYLDGEPLFPETWSQIIQKNTVDEQTDRSPEPSFRLAMNAIIFVSVFCTLAVVLPEIENIGNLLVDGTRPIADQEGLIPPE